MTGYSKIKLKRYDGGGLTPQGATSGFNFLGDTVDGFNNGGTGGGSVALGTLSSGLKGAAAGTAILPGIGTAVGAGIGLVSGFIGSENKRKQLLLQQKRQQDAQAGIARGQSNQVLRSYANNGVEDEQLYAEGGLLDGPPTRKMAVDTGSTYDRSILTNGKFITSEGTDANGNPILKQWGNPLPNLNPLNNKSTLPQIARPVINPASYNPVTFQNMNQPGRNVPNNPSIPEIQPSHRYAAGGKVADFSNKIHNGTKLRSLADGGSLAIKPSHKGRFTAYLKRTGETAHEAAHSKNAHVRQMANYAINIGHTKMDEGGYTDPSMYEAEGGETVQGQDAQMEQSTPLASDMQQINGPSHEQGGVMGQGGERIFSNRLKISPNLQGILRTNGIKVKGNSTYADVSNKLGKLKGKFEAKTDGIGKQTAALMLPRIEQSLDNTFNDQEAGKATRAYKKFGDGGVPRLNLPTANLATEGYNSDAINLPAQQASTIQSPITLTDDEYSNPSIWSKAGNFINNNPGQVANAGNYLANLGSINKLNTTVNPSYLSTPNYNYVDRSGGAVSRNNALLKTGIRGLTNNGNSVNASNIGALFAKTQEGNAYIAANEDARKDAYDKDFNDRSTRINAENVGIYNKAQDDTRDLYNQKVAARLSARNAFQQGIVGNIAAKQSADLERKKLMTVLAANDNNGVMSRALTPSKIASYQKLLGLYNSGYNGN